MAVNAYCAVADVQAITQVTYSVSTRPTTAQVEGFIDNRAAELYGRIRTIMKSDAVGPASSDYTNEIDTTSDVGLALSRALEQSNAIAAAIDALDAAQVGEEPLRSDRLSDLADMYTASLESIELLAVEYVEQSALIISTAFTAGEITRGTVTQRTVNLPLNKETKW